ncbi:MAG: glycosyltransferase [Phycisphaerae bacterium]
MTRIESEPPAPARGQREPQAPARGGGNRCRVSVVIPTYKRPEVARKAILSVLNQDLDPDRYEVIVVDSSPDDRVVSVVKELREAAPCALRCYVKKAEGPGPSRNFGAQHARGEFIALMDSDCFASPGWLRAGMGAFDDSTIGLIQGRTLPQPDVPTGIFTRYVRVESENFIYECANLFYRRAAFEQAGGFGSEYNDDAYPSMGGEDVDLAWRVKRSGWRSGFCAAALVHHEVQPISMMRWVCIKPLYIWPLLTRNNSELRKFFPGRYFFDKAQGLFVLGLAGVALSWITPVFTVLFLPYFVFRASEPTKSLPGILRPIRAMAYFARDLTTFLVLMVASVRFRCLLL